MPILFRYLFMAYLGGFIQVLGIFTGLFFLMDGMEQFRELASANAPGSDIALILLLRLPSFLTQFLPAIALLTTLMVVSGLVRHSEITAMRACGVSIYRILIPILAGGLLIAAFHFLIQDQVVSRTSHAATLLKARYDGKKQTTSSAQTDIWLRDGDTLIHAKRSAPREKALFGITTLQFEPPFKLVARIEAEKAVLENGKWSLENGVRYNFDQETGTETFTRRPWETTLTTDQLDRNTPPPESLSFLELFSFSDRVREEGYDASSYEVVLHRKAADPLTTLAAIILALPFSVRASRSGGTTTALIGGVIAGFSLFAVVDFTSALGLGGRIPPFLAAWSPMILFTCLGGWLLVHLEEEISAKPAQPSLFRKALQALTAARQPQ